MCQASGASCKDELELHARRADQARVQQGQPHVHDDHVVLGPPSAGKSSVLVNPISEKDGVRVLDSDMIMEMKPEFNGGLNANYVHEESKHDMRLVRKERISLPATKRLAMMSEEEKKQYFSNRAKQMKAEIEANPDPEGWENWMVLCDCETTAEKEALVKRTREQRAQRLTTSAENKAQA